VPLPAPPWGAIRFIPWTAVADLSLVQRRVALTPSDVNDPPWHQTLWLRVRPRARDVVLLGPLPFVSRLRPEQILSLAGQTLTTLFVQNDEVVALDPDGIRTYPMPSGIFASRTAFAIDNGVLFEGADPSSPSATLPDTLFDQPN
jgi:hypothetical protein